MLFVAAPNAHTYRLLIFKDLVQLAEEAFCSSAKKEEYEAFAAFRQPSFSRFTLHLHALFREGQNYSKPFEIAQGLALSLLIPHIATACATAFAPFLHRCYIMKHPCRYIESRAHG